MFKTEKTALFLTAGAGLLLIASGAGVYLFLSAQEASKFIPAGANVVPQNAMMTISVTTDPGQWSQLQRYGTPESKAAFGKLLGDLRDRLLTDNGYGYEQDIKPWVGNSAMIAFLPNDALLTPPASPTPNTTPTNPAQQSVAVILPIANPLKAKELLSQPKPLKQGKLVERNYKGVQIAETQGVPERNFSVAVLGAEYLSITNDPKTTDRIIDTYKGGESISKTPGFTNALEQINTASPFAQVYVNIPMAAVYSSLNSTRPVSQQNLEQLQQNQGFATSINLENSGVGFRAISWLKPNSQRKLAVENNAQKMLPRLPSNTLMTLSGGNFQRLWKDYILGAEANPLAPINPQALRTGIKSQTGMDWDKDFVNWMGGEFSLSLIAAPKAQSPGNFAAGFVLMVESSDKKAADQAFKQLDTVMKGKQFKVEETKINQQPAVKWTSPFGGVTITRGWMDGNIAFMSVGAPVLDSVLPAPKTALVSSERFQKTVQSDLKPNNGLFFIDTDGVFNPKNLSLVELPPSQKVWMDAIESLGVTTAVATERSTRYDAFVKLKAGETSNSPAGSSPASKASPKP